MKQITLLTIFSIIGLAASAQNYIGAPVGLYGPAYNGSTTIGDGGSILVQGNGNWYLGGNVISADKGGANGPNAVGRAELIVFDGSGTYDNAATLNGETGFIIDGYAGATNKTTPFILPIGEGTVSHPVTLPSNVPGNVAYFSGLGTEQSADLNGTNAVVYSPYFDIDGLNAGDYVFGFENGFGNSSDIRLLESGNTSVNGTDGSTSYNDIPGTISYDNVTGVLNASITNTYAATQVYLGNINSALPVGLHGFGAAQVDGMVQLVWHTSFESNNRGFVVQRSQDGVNFQSIGFVPSLAADNGGNSSLDLSYVYEDNTNLTAGTYYYRLLQEDLNAQQFSSNTIHLTIGTLADAVKVYPNPTTGKFWVEGLENGTHIDVYNAVGQKVKSTVVNNSRMNVDLSGCAQGMYYLRFTTKGTVIGGTNLLIK